MRLINLVVFLTGLLNAELSKTQVSEVKNAEEVIFSSDLFKSKTNQLYIEKKSIVRVNMTNKSNLPKTVFGVTGYYTDPKDAGKKQIKISTDKVQILVKPGKTTFLKYRFTPQSIDAGPVGIMIIVDFYDSEEPAYRSVGGLHAVELVYADSLYDFQSISIYLLMTGIAAWIGSFYFPNFLAKSGSGSGSGSGRSSVASAASKAKAAAPKKDPVPEGQVDMDWIPDHVKQIEKQKAAAKRK